MPAETVAIRRVVSTLTLKEGFVRYLVDGETTDWPQRLIQFETVSDWLASLCSRAQAIERPVEIVWKDSRYGRQIVTVELVA